MWLISFIVFIHWYLLLRQRQWHSGLPTGKGRQCCYVWSAGVAELGSERDKTVESYQPLKRRRTPQCPGLDPKVTSEVTAVRKSCLMTDDEGYWRRGVTYQKKAEQNLFGWGFVHISGEYVKGCWHSWTRHLPWLDVKLRNLASTRRTSLEFWRQDVERLILCKLQFWLWRGRKTKSSLLATKVTFEKLRILKQTCNLWLVGRAALVSGPAYNQAAGQLVETQYAMIAHVFVVSETYVHCWRPMLSGDTAVTWHKEHFGMETAIELFFFFEEPQFCIFNPQCANNKCTFLTGTGESSCTL